MSSFHTQNFVCSYLRYLAVVCVLTYNNAAAGGVGRVCPAPGLPGPARRGKAAGLCHLQRGGVQQGEVRLRLLLLLQLRGVRGLEFLDFIINYNQSFLLI